MKIICNKSVTRIRKSIFILRAKKEIEQQGNSLELTTGVATLILAAAGAVLFTLSFTTGYYTFGQMQSTMITILFGLAMTLEVVALIVRVKMPEAFWPKFLTFAVTTLLVASAALIVGDRVEGIGNCIVTDYDSGHGGEEAIYMSLAGAILMLIATIYNIIGSFSKDKVVEKASAKKRDIGFGVSLAVVLLAVVIPTTVLVWGGSGNTGSGRAGTTGATVGSGTYTISLNQVNGNTEGMTNYQFLCSDLSGMVQADSRFYIDMTLTLDGNGGYTLFTDAYVIEGGKRAEIGDDTGLGMILTTNAEGTYADNGDGTVTTSVPSHVVFEMQMDTYSAQMKEAAGMGVNGNSEDGVYDSNDEPAVLDFVPETVWTLEDGAIRTWRNANAGGAYKVSFNQANGNAEDMPDYQFLCSDLSGMVQADSRFYIDVNLTLDGNGGYTLFTEAYVIEAGKRAEIGDDTGLGMILSMNAEGTYTENADGTYTTAVPTHAVFAMETDTYSAQMKEAAGMNVNGNAEDGVYDSNDEPAVLDFVPETVWTLDRSAIVNWTNPNEGDEEEEQIENDSNELTVTSDDGATTFTFNADGTYRFAFEAYGVEDLGTYAYDGTTLTVTDANGNETTAEGDPLKFHYVSAISDQLTGDFTVDAADIEALLNGEASEEALTITSDDGATTFTFYDDGTYRFAFEAYSVEDLGTYAYDGTTLTVTDANGNETTAEGDPLKFHYVSTISDQLTGDFTVSAADFQ